MELEEIIKEIVTKKGGYKEFITKEDLIPYYYHLINCKIFKDCKVEFLDDVVHPTPKSVKLSNSSMFTGTVWIKDFHVTPPVYSIDDLNKRPENNGLISPAFYNPKDFEPYKCIKIWFSPKNLSDPFIKDDRNSLMVKFNDILDNPDEYAAPRTHGVIMKGLFKMKEEYDKAESLHINI